MTRLKQGDTVIVNAGAQKGETGRVLKIDRTSNSALVEGINMKWKHLRPSQENPQGGRSRSEYPVDLSNLSFYDAASGKGVRLGTAVVDGKKVRVMRPGDKPVDA